MSNSAYARPSLLGKITKPLKMDHCFDCNKNNHAAFEIEINKTAFYAPVLNYTITSLCCNFLFSKQSFLFSTCKIASFGLLSYFKQLSSER